MEGSAALAGAFRSRASAALRLSLLRLLGSDAAHARHSGKMRDRFVATHGVDSSGEAVGSGVLFDGFVVAAEEL
jgi:hypothetical protein